MTGVAHPAVLLVVVATAGLAGVELAVETLAPRVEQELEGLQTPDAVRLGQAGLVAQQLPLGVFSFDFGLQLPGKEKFGHMEELRSAKEYHWDFIDTDNDTDTTYRHGYFPTVLLLILLSIF